MGGRRLAVLVVAILLIGGVVVLVARDDSSDEGGERGSDLPPAGPVIERVERIRGLRFERPPVIEAVDMEELEERLAEADEQLDEEAREQIERSERALPAVDALLVLTGILTREEARELQGGGGAAATAPEGVYVGELDRLFVLQDVVDEAPRDIVEQVMAHELTHALEDQRFRSFDSPASFFSEESGARAAFSEGTATLVEIEYERRHGGGGEFDRLLEKRRRGLTAGGVPEIIAEASAFTYIAGARFARALVEHGGRRLLDRANRRFPRTTEQVLHPSKWIRGEGARGRPRTAFPGRGWRRGAAFDLGEFDTRLLLGSGVDRSAATRAAAGWGSGRVGVWSTRRPEGCEVPCRRSTIVALSWLWDTDRDAREFMRTAPDYVREALRARPRGTGAWTVAEGAVALAGRGRASALVFAPDLRRARSLAAASTAAAGR